MNTKRILALFLSCCLLITCLSACKKEETAKSPLFNSEAEIYTVESGIVAQNGDFHLIWDDETKQVSLKDEKTGALYSNVPTELAEPKFDEFGMPIKINPIVSSALVLKYVDSKTDHEVNANSSLSAVKNGRVSAEKVKDGIKVTYYFDEVQISVPVIYTVNKRGISATVETKEIAEGGNRLIEVSLSPFFCSINNESENSYLMIPSGSGALIYPKTISGTGVSNRYEIYGTDPMVQVYDKLTNEEPVRIPAFGAKSGDRAVLCIVEQGAESAFIDTIVGGSSYGHSAAFTTIRVRGYDKLRARIYTGNIRETDYYTDNIVENKFTVSYMPLYNDKANYVGMAEAYRNYLIEAEDLQKTENEKSFAITVNGGFMTSKSFLGIPYRSLEALTTIEEAYNMAEELYKLTDTEFSLKLKGFGVEGIDFSKLAGGYKINSKLGSTKQLNHLGKFTKENGIDAYFDFDVIRFRNRGDKAIAANEKVYKPRNYSVNLRTRLDNTAYSLLSRSELPSVISKLINKTEKWNDVGYSFESLGEIAYSDYNSFEYAIKKNTATQVSKQLKDIRKMSRGVALNGANAYAAVNADVVFSSPMNSTKSDVFDEEIPFYQAVFKGYVPLTSTAINISAVPRNVLLSAIESGIAPQWSLMDEYDVAIINVLSDSLHCGVYDEWKEDIVSTVNELKDYYKSINGATIVSHSLLENGVRVTVFDNGVTVAVNKSEKAAQSPLGEIGAGEYRIGGKKE